MNHQTLVFATRVKALFVFALLVQSAMGTTNDVAKVARIVVSNGLALACSADNVKSLYAVCSACTNGMAIDITASNTSGTASNYLFVYNLSDLSKPSNISISDSTSNGFDYCFDRKGEIGSYQESKGNELNGICVYFYSNGQVRSFCTFSNWYMIGTNYIFDISGNISQVITAIPPILPTAPQERWP